MGKQQIYDIEKKELSDLISDMTLENLRTTLDNIQAHIDLLRCLDRAEYKFANSEYGIDNLVLLEDHSLEIIPEAEPSYQEGWAGDKKYYIGKFYRHLRGGMLGTEKDIYVPESVVRKLELEYLDWVKAAIIYTGNGYSKARYEYSLLEKHKDYDTESLGEIEKRKIIKYGIVKYEESIKRYYINSKDENTDLLYKIALLDSDINKFKIKIGDIIEYAYWQDDIINGRITWKHQQDADDAAEKATPKAENTSSVSKKQKKSAPSRALKPTFQDYTICMVGGGNRNLHRGIKEEVERRSGKFIFCSGDEPKNTIEGKLKKADFVVVFTESISHDSMHFTKSICKKHNLTVTYTKNLGNAQFVTRVNLLIKKTKKDYELCEENLVMA